MHEPIPQAGPAIRQRPRSPAVENACIKVGLSALQARIVAGRVHSLDEAPDRIVRPKLADLHDPALLADAERAAARLATAVVNQECVGILTDYDVDGITSHAIVFEALTRFFGLPAGRVQHHIGHRLQDGYGISASLTDRILALQERPAVIVTADCGSSDQAQLERLAAADIDVIVTDHHAIPAEGVPAAAHSVVNPTRDDCTFPDRTVAGCMVSWMLMCEVRRRLIATGKLAADAPKLGTLLDFVALGTVADAVSLFGAGNRAVVLRGLQEMNRMKRPCWRALARLLGRPQGYSVQDLGFQMGPRINARGRMADPMAALRFVLASDDAEAARELEVLDADNRDRRETESQMLAIARAMAVAQLAEGRVILMIYHPSFHAGVQGIVASRLVDAFGHPAVVLSPGMSPGQLSGSARSIDGLDIRQALQGVADADGDLLHKFGGHVGAAGLSVDLERVAQLHSLLDAQVALQLRGRELGPELLTDGCLEAAQLVRETVGELEVLAPYGREFDVPLFEGNFLVRSLRRVGNDGTHVALDLMVGERPVRAIWFRAVANSEAALPLSPGQHARLAYRLERDEYRGGDSVQLLVAGAGPLN